MVGGEYFADLSVEDQLLRELTTVKALADAHRPQGTNDLKASGLRLNLSRPRLEITRTAGKSHTANCVFRVHPPASALEFFLRPRHHRSAIPAEIATAPVAGGSMLNRSESLWQVLDQAADCL